MQRDWTTPPAAGLGVRLDGLGKRFGERTVLDGVDLDIRPGDFVAIVGRSGCGKSTLLRLLAGLETPSTGAVALDGAPLAAHRDEVRIMFQEARLLPWRTVLQNVRLGLETQDGTRRAREALAQVGLADRAGDWPAVLSGGQRQRVALARALARRPQLLLLDEPLAALDKKLRENTQGELLELQRRLGMTFIIVTHDQEEAMTMASRIGVMRDGKLAQVAGPRELYEAPRSRWIAEFVGDVNLFDGEFKLRDGHRLVIATQDAGTLVVAEPREPVGEGRLSVAIRPEKVKLSRRGPVSEIGLATSINSLDGVIADICYLGGTTTYKVKLDAGGMVQAAVANSARLDVDAYSLNQRVVTWFTPDDCVVLPS
jgi:putrescine transport system ATP-binding protein